MARGWAIWPVINGGSMVERSYAADFMSMFVSMFTAFSNASAFFSAHISPRGMSSEIKTSILPLDDCSMAFFNSRTNRPYSAR
jgi:hypothetical protein